MAASSIGKKPQGGMLPCEGLRNLAREKLAEVVAASEGNSRCRLQYGKDGIKLKR